MFLESKLSHTTLISSVPLKKSATVESGHNTALAVGPATLSAAR